MTSRKRGKDTLERVQLRIPAALKAYWEDLAAEHGISLNEEITRLMSRPQRKQHMPMDPRIFRQLMALEPLASNPSVPVEEVARRMEEINPYRGPGLTDQLMDGTQAR